jgi:hypothetical protein
MIARPPHLRPPYSLVGSIERTVGDEVLMNFGGAQVPPDLVERANKSRISRCSEFIAALPAPSLLAAI